MPDNALSQPTAQWVPESYSFNSFLAFQKAYELDAAALELHILAHPGETSDNAANRHALLELARRLIIAQRDKYMDHAVELWIKYRTMQDPDNG